MVEFLAGLGLGVPVGFIIAVALGRVRCPVVEQEEEIHEYQWDPSRDRPSDQ